MPRASIGGCKIHNHGIHTWVYDHAFPTMPITTMNVIEHFKLNQKQRQLLRLCVNNHNPPNKKHDSITKTMCQKNKKHNVKRFHQMMMAKTLDKDTHMSELLLNILRNNRTSEHCRLEAFQNFNLCTILYDIEMRALVKIKELLFAFTRNDNMTHLVLQFSFPIFLADEGPYKNESVLVIRDGFKIQKIEYWPDL